MKLQEIIKVLENFAPLALQESYDNAGLLIGDREMEITGALVSLDVTEPVLKEALAKQCNLIIAHHPLIFRGIKSLTGKNAIERITMQAIKNDIAIYAIHTNLDNTIAGVNGILAQKLGLTNTAILSPKKELLRKLVTFCPTDHSEKVREAIFNAGAGHIVNISHAEDYTAAMTGFSASQKRMIKEKSRSISAATASSPGWAG